MDSTSNPSLFPVSRIGRTNALKGKSFSILHNAPYRSFAEAVRPVIRWFGDLFQMESLANRDHPKATVSYLKQWLFCALFRMME